MSNNAIADVLRSLDREVWIVTAADGDRLGGLVATSATNASIVPDMPRVLVTIARQHHTWELIEATGGFALHLLDESQLDLVGRFGLQSGHQAAKFDGVDFRRSAGGSPLLSDAPAWLDCRVANRMETGDRTVYLADVVEGECRPGLRPLTMERLLEIAPAEMRAEMKSQRQADAARDAEAIRAWRGQ